MSLSRRANVDRPTDAHAAGRSPTAPGTGSTSSRLTDGRVNDNEPRAFSRTAQDQSIAAHWLEDPSTQAALGISTSPETPDAKNDTRLKRVFRWLGKAVKGLGRKLLGVLRDTGLWALNAVRDLPRRMLRLLISLFDGVSGALLLLPRAIIQLATNGWEGFGKWLLRRALQGIGWAATLMSRFGDLAGAPEALMVVWQLFATSRRLTPEERRAGELVLGPNALRYGDVRCRMSKTLDAIKETFGGTVYFVTFHVINSGTQKYEFGDVVHELVHVLQYEKHGSVYLGRAIGAQLTEGYSYGGALALAQAHADGKTLRDFNYEQQGDIAKDYYNRLQRNHQVSAYLPFIEDLRAGRI